MENQHTNRDDVYEQYVDASVALFMKYYCDTLYEDVTDREVSAETDADAVFPAGLDARCRTLIKKAVKRQRLRKRARYTGKVLRYVCSFMIVCMALASFLFVTVDAVRVPIINYYIEHSENNILEIGGNDASAENTLNNEFDIFDPLSGLIPDDYVLITHEGDTISNFTTIYRNSQDNSIFISGQPLSDVRDIDLQDADDVTCFQIYNCEAIVAEENGVTRLVWIHEELSATFTLIISSDADLDAIKIANQIIRKIS